MEKFDTSKDIREMSPEEAKEYLAKVAQLLAEDLQWKESLPHFQEIIEGYPTPN